MTEARGLLIHKYLQLLVINHSQILRSRRLPVNADHDKDAGGEDEPAGPKHHQNFTENVPRLPLDGQPPDGLHGEEDEADDGVRHGEVEYEEVDVGSTLNVRSQRKFEINS